MGFLHIPAVWNIYLLIITQFLTGCDLCFYEETLVNASAPFKMQDTPLALKIVEKFHTKDQLNLVQCISVWDLKKKYTFLTTKNSSPVI